MKKKHISDATDKNISMYQNIGATLVSEADAALQQRRSAAFSCASYLRQIQVLLNHLAEWQNKRVSFLSLFSSLSDWRKQREAREREMMRRGGGGEGGGAVLMLRSTPGAEARASSNAHDAICRIV